MYIYIYIYIAKYYYIISTIMIIVKGDVWGQALRTLAEMRARGWRPNAISYNSAISACEKGARWALALGSLSEMFDAALEPDVISFSAAISACEKVEIVVITILGMINAIIINDIVTVNCYQHQHYQYVYE